MRCRERSVCQQIAQGAIENAWRHAFVVEGEVEQRALDDLPTAALFPSHCDIVVEGPKSGAISVVGGNVQDAVTMRHVPVTADGRLAGQDGVVLDQRMPWMVVLRVHEPAG